MDKHLKGTGKETTLAEKEEMYARDFKEQIN
jgi:hypothetical protein